MFVCVSLGVLRVVDVVGIVVVVVISYSAIQKPIMLLHVVV